MSESRRIVHIGYCIYCGVTSKDLSTEHVAPFALGGTEVLLKASCTGCGKITSKFEGFCTRTILGPFRVRTGAPTRRPQKRPAKLPLELIGSDGSFREVEVPAGEHPATLVLPVFDEPGLLAGGPSQESKQSFKMWFALPDTNVFNLPQRHSASAMKIGSFEISNFSRLLAKIAHAAAFYTDSKWTTSFEPLLVDLILGKTTEHKALVGGNGLVNNAPEDMSFPIFFESVDGGEDRYLVAEFRLFAENGTPVYRVVSGRKRRMAGG